jgi:hypothetical protein
LINKNLINKNSGVEKGKSKKKSKKEKKTNKKGKKKKKESAEDEKESSGDDDQVLKHEWDGFGGEDDYGNIATAALLSPAGQVGSDDRGGLFTSSSLEKDDNIPRLSRYTTRQEVSVLHSKSARSFFLWCLSDFGRIT